MVTVIAIAAILLQNLPFSWATAGLIVALVIPVVGAVRRFGPTAWRPNHRLGTTIPDLLAESAMVAVAVALMPDDRRVPAAFGPAAAARGLTEWRRLLAQNPFQDLSGCALGQLVDEVDAVWSLVDGELAAAVLDDLLLCG